MPPLIHALTHPGDFTSSAVVCGDPHAVAATWDPRRVTCPGCTKAVRRFTPADGGMSEKALQETIRQAALAAGWLYYHPRMSLQSTPGFPDTTMVRGEMLLFAELKVGDKTPTPAQQRWLDALGYITRVETAVWYPADLEQALEVLR